MTGAIHYGLLGDLVSTWKMGLRTSDNSRRTMEYKKLDPIGYVESTEAPSRKHDRSRS